MKYEIEVAEELVPILERMRDAVGAASCNEFLELIFGTMLAQAALMQSGISEFPPELGAFGVRMGDALRRQVERRHEEGG